MNIYTRDEEPTALPRYLQFIQITNHHLEDQQIMSDKA